ncbi:MAG: hypothetical protein R2941_02705 [Desulfobacterales bacterium]
MKNLLNQSLDDLARKTPRELREMSESLRFGDEKWLEEMIAGQYASGRAGTDAISSKNDYMTRLNFVQYEVIPIRH